jgi:hypothetical protein
VVEVFVVTPTLADVVASAELVATVSTFCEAAVPGVTVVCLDDVTVAANID